MEEQTYKGLSLFNEVEPMELKSHNRGVTMANVFEAYVDKRTKKVSPGGLALILGYFQQIIPFERREAKLAFDKILIQRGIKNASEAA
jgi:hypothetical protein